MKTSSARISLFGIALAVIIAMTQSMGICGSLPDPKTGGKGDAPISLLFLFSSIGSKLDAEVQKRLETAGFTIRSASVKEPLTAEILREYNAVILVGVDDYSGDSCYSVGGTLMENVSANMRLVQEYVDAGGGVLVMPSIGGPGLVTTVNDFLAPWGAAIACEMVSDSENSFGRYSWTKNITSHPVTEGVTSLAYPSRVMRWCDDYPNVAVIPSGDWKVLVRGEQSSQGMRATGADTATPGETGKAPVLAAVREQGKGRVAIIGLDPIFLLTCAFQKGGQVGELTTGLLEGTAYEKGDGKTPSHWGHLLENTLRWLDEGSVKAGMGGTPAPWVCKINPLPWTALPDDPVPGWAVIDWARANPLPTWEERLGIPVFWRGKPYFDSVPDPAAKTPQKMNKVLIGAHSKYSDGSGSVAEWAAAAKAAGYKVLVFTEKFESFDPKNWSEYVKECRTASSADLVCLQGFDISDVYGNRWLVMATETYPKPTILTPDGKFLANTASLSLGFSRHISALHRPGTAAITPEMIRHFQAVSVFTYSNDGDKAGAPVPGNFLPPGTVHGNDGKYRLVDNGLPAYHWQLKASSNPIPIVVHELRNPADVEKKGTMGFQLVVPSQDARDCARYFRGGFTHFFESPQRYFITEGPVIDKWSILNRDIGLPELNRDHFRVDVGASAGEEGTQITEAVMYDHDGIFRRWLPGTPKFSEVIDGEQGQQHYFMLVVKDSKGRRAISPALRTVTQGYFTRCADRQNFFGAAFTYMGIWAGGHDFSYFIPSVPNPFSGEALQPHGGAQQGENLGTKFLFTLATNPATFTDILVDERYRYSTSYGMDQWPNQATAPSRTMMLLARVGVWNDIVTSTEGNAGQSPYTNRFITVDGKLRLKMPVQPTNELFPVLNKLQPNAAYRYPKDGKIVEGKLDGNPKTRIDLPPGGSIANFVFLTPISVLGNGTLGWISDTTRVYPVDSEWKFKYLYATDMSGEWLQSLGIEGQTPWGIETSQGKLDPVFGTATLTAKDYGAAGVIKAGGKIKLLPLVVNGLNANWPAASWTPGKHLLGHNAGVPAKVRMMSDVPKIPGMYLADGETFLNHIGVLEGAGHATLDVGGDSPFYVGNTLIATNPALVLSFSHWDKKSAGIQVHNPTDAPVKAHASSPKAITDRFKVDVDVDVPAGATKTLELPPR